MATRRSVAIAFDAIGDENLIELVRSCSILCDPSRSKYSDTETKSLTRNIRENEREVSNYRDYNKFQCKE